jgi:spore coat protein U-like protein
MKIRAIAFLAALGASVMVGNDPALAGTTAPANVAVSLRIVNSCTLSTGAVLDFGSQNAGFATSNIDAASSGLSISCSDAQASATINVSGGNNLAAAGQRRLRQGATSTYINYDLYEDAGRTTKFDSTLFQPLVGGLIAGTRDIVIYGRILSGTALPLGNGADFTDVVQVTVNY